MARELTTLIESRGKPAMIVSDNGTEFTANAMLAWTEEHDIIWHVHGRFRVPMGTNSRLSTRNVERWRFNNSLHERRTETQNGANGAGITFTAPEQKT